MVLGADVLPVTSNQWPDLSSFLHNWTSDQSL